jgi:hypothetical protein
LLAAAFALLSVEALAGTPAPVPVLIANPVPALDDAGITILAVAIGGVAGWIVRRRRRK